MHAVRLLVGLLTAACAAGCTDGPAGPAAPDDGSVAAPKCISGQAAACACTDGTAGAQTCHADGTFGPCVCALRDATTSATGDAGDAADGGADALPGDGASADGAPVDVESDATADADSAAMGAMDDSPADAWVPGVTAFQSCGTSGPGRTNCGGGSESCCTTLAVPGGTFYQSYQSVFDNTTDGGYSIVRLDASTQGASATISGFRLDKYEVTVGRFRSFVNAWNGGAGWLPPAGSGKHTHLNGGAGLLLEPGWVATDDANVAPTAANFANCGNYTPTWTSSAGANENLPVNCVNWYEAYAFCIWDGGFLPTQAEGEYAAAGGDEQREFPWGAADPGTSNQYAIYGCYYSGPAAFCASTNVASIAPVGTPSLGAGRWGQLDLAGNLGEWSLDGTDGPMSCTDCYYGVGGQPCLRGGDYGTARIQLIPDIYSGEPRSTRFGIIGFRCARSP
ncbi:MAG TPA: SUMF1/EgtB/PvdO family nonheme iron enzyme [Polyangiaceae bacterium]|nr:SUMF1/EgtB/PvdO family nonheme iron enzyme [Polyangiaceae bacterium]